MTPLQAFRSLLLSFALSTIAGAALSQGASVAFGTLRQDTNAPVEMAADELSVDQSSGTAVFSGNVLIGQGDMRLSAARVLVIYAEDKGGIDRLEATGGVTLVSGEDAAEASRADYDIENGVIVMTGDVLLTQGTSALTAERMTVNLETGTAQMSGRVKSILQPSGE